MTTPARRRGRSAGELHRRIHRGLEILDVADIALAAHQDQGFAAVCHQQATRTRGAYAAAWRGLAACPANRVRDALAAEGIVLFPIEQGTRPDNHRPRWVRQ
jgi:hypothetical protein